MEESAISVCAKRRFVQTVSKLVDSLGTIVYENNVVQSGK